VVAGLDSEGKGAVYTYDAVGSFERVGYAAQGAGQKLIIPLLDNLVGGKNRKDKVPSLSAEAAVELCKDAFITAGERDIYTGDSVEIVLMTKNGMKREVFQLKKD
jgi:20S proteasome subunit beta 6